jgi:hypothetical protein
MHQNSINTEQESLLWAEAKTNSSDIYNSISQLILTIGKARTFDKFLPPPMLGAIDGEKIAFITYNEIQDIFYQNDFNWNVTPSDYKTKEFQLIHTKVKNSIDENSLIFYFERDDKELRNFIKQNFVVGKFGQTKTKIDKNNFMVIYNKWLQTVKPTIAVNWDIAKKNGIIDGDFYLADLLSRENISLKEKLFVLLKNDHYELDRKINEYGLFSSSSTSFIDNQKAHIQFWNKYERPPKEVYWDYIVERRDLLVPQDIRERKGSFFTPQIWVELSQKYLSNVLGEDWQDEYYIWDCAAGTGNLLTGLTNKYNIWASTLDKQDVDVMHERIDTMNKNSVSGNGANLLKDHVFQFDFLNDNFSKLPQTLQNVIENPEKRKKLVIYINPPYAEVSSIGKKGKKGVNISNTHKLFSKKIGTAGREIFILFLVRIYEEINGCIIGEFSKLKTIQGSAFLEFRKYFQAELIKTFIMPAYTFDNVKGNFPIGFKIWNTNKHLNIKNAIADIFNKDGIFIGKKTFSVTEKNDFINKWISKYKINSDYIGFLAGTNGNDFQQNKIVYILNKKEQMSNPRGIWISSKNLIPISIYLSIRHCTEQTWLNDRDQFLHPNKKWQKDEEFKNDCLAYTLFHGQNRISSTHGTNHWIPFSENEVNAREKFESNFMSKYIKGKLPPEKKQTDIFSILLEPKAHYESPLKFSDEANAVFDAGRELWRYYHTQNNCNVNASLYDIREHFQGRNESGKMNIRSNDETYTKHICLLREKLELLAQKIEPKVYEYEFLKR